MQQKRPQAGISSNQTSAESAPFSTLGNTFALTNLLQDSRYAWITHAGETYLLQLTKSNKLLLTK